MRAYFADRGERSSGARSSSRTPRTARTRPALPWPATRWSRCRSTSAATSTSTIFVRKVGPQTAGLMLTNPSTLGLFEERITEIATIFHDAGALLYYDGANLNAVCGISRPGDMGFDILHFNLHKTFSQPHGGGGPGAGPVAVARASSSRTCRRPSSSATATTYRLDHDRPKSIGRVRGFGGAVRRVRSGLRVHPHVGPGTARDVGDRGAQRQLPAGPAARGLRPAVRPPLHARVRALGSERSSASTASPRSTSPSA